MSTREQIALAGLACCALACTVIAENLTATTAPCPDRVVVLTFDDAVKSHATFVAPLLKKYGFGATFFICEFPPDFASDKSKYMTWEQIRSLHEAGFEIANHTRTHTHVNKMHRERMIEELEYIENRCTEFGITKPISFAYPGYDTHPTSLSTLREKGYGFARAGGSRPYRPNVDDPLLIPSFSTTGSNKKRVIDALKQAVKGQIVVLTIHGVPDTAHPHVTTPPKLFAEYMRFLHDNDCTVIAMRDLAKYVEAEAPSHHKIDRRALVTRHNITLNKPDPLTPLSVGNGEFAFTADITGLQTFPDYHEKGMPLGTQSQWGWHSMPNPEAYALSDVLALYDVSGRGVPYASDENHPDGYSPAAAWLRSNPHRLDLGRIQLRLTKLDGSRAGIDDLTNTAQTLNLWTGLLSSRFEVDSQPVLVRTVCHPARDILAVRIESRLLQQGRLSVSLAFPYGSTEWRNSADWSSPNRHKTQSQIELCKVEFIRSLDSDRYYVRLLSPTKGQVKAVSQHEYEISQPDHGALEVVFGFSSKKNTEVLPGFDRVRAAAAGHWQSFWSTAGAIDFSQCTDPRALELERRVVLSQYLTAINCAGSYPPQETGLVCNSWHGKFHLEMHWWHGVHFALWDRLKLLEKSLPWYRSILP
ncbi:MAG: polysaccharide deacetylase family protein, partial [Phycisphaerales bacterium]